MIDTRVKVTACVLYVRQSDARDDERKGGIDYHEKILRAEAARRHWPVAAVIIENDVPDGKGGTKRRKSASAFKRVMVTMPDGSVVERVVRPGFEKVLKGLSSGRFNGMLAVELDRSVRDPRDLENLMDVVRAKKLNVGSVGGTLQFTDGGTDDEIDRARFLVLMANRESRTKSNRTKNYRARDARLAKACGGNRPFGWPDWKHADWIEKEVVVSAMRRFLQGVSLMAMAAELREADVPTVTGASWSAQTLRDILLKPRNAGLVVYDGDILDGVTGEWEPLVSVELWKAVHDKLTDPSRVTVQPGACAPKWQGTGAYLCGNCDDGTSVQVTKGKRNPRYRCATKNHLTRNAAWVDAMVNDWIVNRLSQDDAIDLFAPSSPDVDVVSLQTERDALRENLKTMAVDSLTNNITRDEYHAARDYAAKRIPEINQTLSNAVSGDSPVTDLVLSEDVHATYHSYPLATRQAIIKAVVIVKILPTTKPGKFDPESVSIRGRQWPRTENAKQMQVAA